MALCRVNGAIAKLSIKSTVKTLRREKNTTMAVDRPEGDFGLTLIRNQRSTMIGQKAYKNTRK